MKSLAPVEFRGETRSSFKNNNGEEVNFTKVHFETLEGDLEHFEFNITDEKLCETFVNMKRGTQGYAVLDIRQQGKFMNVKLREWRPIKSKGE